MLKIATWNVNSIKARLPHLLSWLREVAPDILLLQEIKVADEAFPGLEVGDLGYNVATVGQRAYNGVAVISKQPIEVLAWALPGDPSDTQARYLEAFTCGLRVASIYAPNGNPIGTSKFDYKLDWLARLLLRAEELLASEDAFILGGDWNVAPTDDDVYNPFDLRNDALCQPETRAAFRRIQHLGLTDAVAALSALPHRYTWWDYRTGGYEGDRGMRIDHLLLSPQAADRLSEADIDRTPRGWLRPSDHAPVHCTLRDA